MHRPAHELLFRTAQISRKAAPCKLRTLAWAVFLCLLLASFTRSRQHIRTLLANLLISTGFFP